MPEEKVWIPVVWSGLSALVGLITGGAITYWFESLNSRANARRDVTLRLFEEFHSSDMLTARSRATTLIKEKSGHNIEALKDALTSEIFQVISLVVHFFEKLQVCRENNQVDLRLSKELLGFYIRWWHSHHYAQLTGGLPEDSEWRDCLNRIDALNSDCGKSRTTHFPWITGLRILFTLLCTLLVSFGSFHLFGGSTFAFEFPMILTVAISAFAGLAVALGARMLAGKRNQVGLRAEAIAFAVGIVLAGVVAGTIARQFGTRGSQMPASSAFTEQAMQVLEEAWVTQPIYPATDNNIRTSGCIEPFSARHAGC